MAGVVRSCFTDVLPHFSVIDNDEHARELHTTGPAARGAVIVTFPSTDHLVFQECATVNPI